MTTGKDTASFFENGTTEQFEYCYKLYPQVLKLKAEKKGKKPQELIRLDHWYQNDLPKQIKARGKDAHIEYDELVQTMKWKQSRGKFYPQLSYLIKVNTPRAVMTETKKAFRKLPNLEQAITALSNLKGVGTTMASALLAAAAPDSAPFMADECLMAIPEIEGIDYTTKEYLNFVQHIETKVARLNTEAGGEKPFWSPHRVELALWAHYVANDLSPELLDQMPGPGAGGGLGNTNGKTKVLDENSQDNTNDADDESLGLGNTNATESETDNENTNPGISAAVDGDSNFVSNDSTSHEPLIDENTTQTTATTSTDDGEVGTPLASDSESNLEAPTKLNNQDIKQQQATQQQQKSIVGSVGGDESQSTVSNDAPPQLLKQLNNNNKNNNNNKSNSSTSSSSNSLKNGNGNGPLNVGSDSLDGDSNSCALGTDEVVSEIDETSEVDDGEDDLARMGADDSSSNSNQKPTTTTAAVTLSASLTEGNSSSGGTGALNLGQKRVHHNTYNVVSSSDLANSIGEQLARDQPELKKLRSE